MVGRYHASIRRRSLAGTLGLVTLLSSLLPLSGARATSTGDIRASIASLTSQLAAEQRQSEVLAEQYNKATSALAGIDGVLAGLRGRAATTQTQINAITSSLSRAVVFSYVYGAADGQILAVLKQDVSKSDARTLYENQVLGNLLGLQQSYQAQERSLQSTLALEAVQRADAARTASNIRSVLAQNAANEVQTNRLLTSLKRQYQSQVYSYEMSVAISCAKQHKVACVNGAVQVVNAVCGTTAANRILLAVSQITGPGAINQAPATSASGLAALNAAKSQIGVPYVWGGETVGRGFDCSGLTQWAWSYAGYRIPRTAADQYHAMRKVSLTALQPGDLLFYYNLDGDHQIDHVVMYAGQSAGVNWIISAAHTGTRISVTPIFTFGLYGAARP